MDEKKKFWPVPGEMEGFGQAFVVSKKQKLEWPDAFYMMTLPDHLRKPHLFPKLPQPFRSSLNPSSTTLMGKSSGDGGKGNRRAVRGWLPGNEDELLPSMSTAGACDGASHSDADGITLLLQVNETEGLQIRKDGMWAPIKPLSNAFIANIGDIMEMISNGIYHSIEHRGTVNAIQERISIATFYSPKMNAEIGPAPSLVTPESPALFRRISVAEHLRGYFSGELRGKAYLDTMRIKE